LADLIWTRSGCKRAILFVGCIVGRKRSGSILRQRNVCGAFLLSARCAYRGKPVGDFGIRLAFASNGGVTLLRRNVATRIQFAHSFIVGHGISRSSACIKKLRKRLPKFIPANVSLIWLRRVSGAVHGELLFRESRGASQIFWTRARSQIR
jgi:hypothetical protein